MQCRVNITTQRRQLITHINTIEMREGDHNHETAHQPLKVLCNHSRHTGTIQYARPAFLKLPQPYRFSNVSHSLICTQPTTHIYSISPALHRVPALGKAPAVGSVIPLSCAPLSKRRPEPMAVENGTVFCRTRTLVGAWQTRGPAAWLEHAISQMERHQLF